MRLRDFNPVSDVGIPGPITRFAAGEAVLRNIPRPLPVGSTTQGVGPDDGEKCPG